MSKKYLLLLIIFSAIMATLGALFQWIAPLYATPAIPFIVLFFFLITMVTLNIIFKNVHPPSEKKFITRYMLSRIVKMFPVFLFLILYIIFNKHDRWNFTGAFLVIYFSYSVFEILVLKKYQ